MTFMRRAAAFVLVAACLAVAGCGGGDSHAKPDLTEAEVMVTIGGQPLPNALVTLSPTDTKYGGSASASGVTDASGRAKLSCGGKPGACIGANKVTVAEAPDENRSDDPDVAQKQEARRQAELKNRPIPAKYATLAQSDLTLEIKKGQTEYKLELKR